MKDYLKTMLSVCAFVACTVSQTALALTARLDDSSSPRSRVPAQVAIGDQGRPLAEAPGSTTANIRFGIVEYRLSTAAFVGRQAHIYFIVPAQIRGILSPSALRVDWRGVGAFSSGSGRPGDRVLVWSGVVRAPWMNEAIDLSMRVDLRQVRLPGNAELGMESYFEIETFP